MYLNSICLKSCYLKGLRSILFADAKKIVLYDIEMLVVLVEKALKLSQCVIFCHRKMLK